MQLNNRFLKITIFPSDPNVEMKNGFKILKASSLIGYRSETFYGVFLM